jgi:hypothetical protein
MKATRWTFAKLVHRFSLTEFPHKWEAFVSCKMGAMSVTGASIGSLKAKDGPWTYFVWFS